MLKGLKVKKRAVESSSSVSEPHPSEPKKPKYGLQVMTKAVTTGSPPAPSSCPPPELDNAWINRGKKLHAKADKARGVVISAPSSSSSNSSAADILRGQMMSNIGVTLAPNPNPNPNTDTNQIILTNLPKHQFEREDMKGGSRQGKKMVKKLYADGHSYSNNPDGPTLQDLINEEKNSKYGMDELYARNVNRAGSRYKGNDVGGAGDITASGFDEEDQIDMTMYQNQNERLTSKAQYDKEYAKQVMEHQKQEKVTSKCSWWIESSKFKKYMMVALGDHVSLVMIPTHQSLTKFHLALVPIKNADAYTSCEQEVWEEVKRFQTSLRKTFKKMKKGVLFMETVLETKSFNQTKMEVVPVPRHAESDAPIFFKSALNERAEEWGTHTKIIDTGKRGGVRFSVPKNFTYFSVDWKDGGMAQIIEGEGGAGVNKEWRSWGLDVCAGMIGCDIMKFNKKEWDEAKDRKNVLDFLEIFKEFDWTAELDDA